jgi:hypothetical protein
MTVSPPNHSPDFVKTLRTGHVIAIQPYLLARVRTESEMGRHERPRVFAEFAPPSILQRAFQTDSGRSGLGRRGIYE